MLFSQWLNILHSYQCYSVEKGIPLSPNPHQHLLFVIFDGSHSDRYEVISHCGFDLHYLIMSGIDHLCMCMLAICRFSLQKYLFSASAQLKKFFFDCAMWLKGSWFPDQGLNLGHSSKNPESQPLLLLLLSCFIMSDSVRPHRWQATRLRHPWDSPGKNTGVVCHFLLQCMKVKSESEVAQSCPTLNDPMDCSPRLLCPWDFPGKTTGVGCHCLLLPNH